MLKSLKTAAVSTLLAGSIAGPAFASISATAPGYQMMHEMEIELVTANNRLAAVPASDLSQVTDIIRYLADDARTVYDAFYPATGVAANVCSRADIVDAMDDLVTVVSTYRDRVQAGNPPADLLVAFNRLTDRLERIEDRLGDSINQAEAGC